MANLSRFSCGVGVTVTLGVGGGGGGTEGLEARKSVPVGLGYGLMLVD